MTNFYELNTLVRVTGSFARSDISGPIDPGDVLLYVRRPDCTEFLYTFSGGDVVKDATGAYHMDLSLSAAGEWRYKWEGTYPVEVGSADVLMVVNQSYLVPAAWSAGATLAGEGDAAG